MEGEGGKRRPRVRRLPRRRAHDDEGRGGSPSCFRPRARAADQSGPWSGFAQFRTPERSATTPRPGTGGPVGPPRNIDIGEAVAIIRAIYDAGRYDLGSGSSRDQRNLYLEIAVATLHYGHGIWNQAGPDSNWCIKNGGPGRPQADDVIARCSTRDAWDLVLSIGANNLFNVNPPDCFSCGLNNFDPTTYDVPGTFFYARATVRM